MSTRIPFNCIKTKFPAFWGSILLSLTFICAEGELVRVTSRLVPVSVIVMDKNGRPVSDLKATDFELWDENYRQDLKYFELETLKSDAELASVAPQIQHQQSFGVKRSNRRTFLILLGRGGANDPFHGIDDLISFIQKDLLPQDYLAVMAYDRASEFTKDPSRILSILSRYKELRPRIELSIWKQAQGNALAAVYGARMTSTAQGWVDQIFDNDDKSNTNFPTSLNASTINAVSGESRKSPNSQSSSDQQVILADVSRDDPELNRLDSGRLMMPDPFDLQQFQAITNLSFQDYIERSRMAELDVHSLFAALSYLRYMEGSKYILYFSDQGLQIPQDEDEHSLIAMANDAQVTIYTYQTGGINSPAAYNNDPLARWGQDDMYALSTLRVLAERTGGQASIHSHIAENINRMNMLTRSRYLLGYEPAKISWDGSYHHIRVKVKRPDTTLAYRQGYFARSAQLPTNGEEFIAYTRIMAAALYREDIQDVRFQLEISKESQAPKSNKRGIKIKIDPRNLRFTNQSDIRSSRIYCAIYYEAANGKDLSRVVRSLDLELSESDYQQAVLDGINITIWIPPSSNNALEAVVYSVENDCVGTQATESFIKRWRQSRINNQPSTLRSKSGIPRR